METSLPIYGLACPDVKKKQIEFDSITKKCGCMTKQAPLTLVHGTIKNGVTNQPFEAGLVSVYNIITKKGTTANAQGAFSLYALPNDPIQISFIGFKTLQIEASKLPITIVLQQKIEQLEEVIITAGKKNNNHLYAGLGMVGLLFIYAIAKDKNKKKTKT